MTAPQIVFPDWKSWLRGAASAAAPTREEYELHLAAHEWALSDPLDINEIDDFASLPLPDLEPFEHQVQNAILFFRRLSPRGLIADDVGLGKTITAGLIARELLVRGRIESILVVCPKSLMDQWSEELLTKFDLRAEAASGAAFANLETHPFWITTYHTARSRIASIRQRKFDLLILDEAHALRNLYGTQKPPQVATAFRDLMHGDAVRFCLMLTATPIQNRLWDIFSLLEVLKAPQPNPLGSEAQFATGFIADAPHARRLRRGTETDFRKRVGEASVRTRRADTQLDFPDRQVKDRLVVPLADEGAFIDEALDAILDLPHLAQLTHARTLMSSPWAFAKSMEEHASRLPQWDGKRAGFTDLARKGRTIKESAKVRAVVDLVRKSIKDGRAARMIVFTQRIETLSHLFTALTEAGLGDQIGMMQGSNPGGNRRAIEDFRADPAVRPILLSTDTGAVGLNLQAGNIVVNYDLPWNPMLIEQRIGRVQRLGQKAAHVIVYNLVLKGTIEESIVHRLMEKLQLFSMAIGEMEELLELCEFGEDGGSLETVIMDLIRKAGEHKDVTQDLAKMEASRRRAEERLREMREATESALASIRPSEGTARLERLERPEPRLPLQDVIRGCLRRGGVPIEEEEAGRFWIREGGRVVELHLDRRSAFSGSTQTRVVSPGSKPFESITRAVRQGSQHVVRDATGVGLERVRANLESRLASFGLVVDGVSEVKRVPREALRVAVKLSSSVSTDRYETILEVPCQDPSHGVGEILEADEAAEPLLSRAPVLKDAKLATLGEAFAGAEGSIREAAFNDENLARFRGFYDARFREELGRLTEKASVNGGGRRSGEDLSEYVRRLSGADAGFAAAFKSLVHRFVPTERVEPVGVSGIRYATVRARVRVRNRKQQNAADLEIDTVPLSGRFLGDLAGFDHLQKGEEGWGCPGGHIAAAASFVTCRECSSGGCRECWEVSPEALGLTTCSVCSQPVCDSHRVTCASCEAVACIADSFFTAEGLPTCVRCSVKLPSGEIVAAADAEVSAVSGRAARKEAFLLSQLSGRPAFPEELVRCEASGRRILPEERVACAVTGKRVGTDLTEVSAVSGERALASEMRRSGLSGRLALPSELVVCDETGESLAPDEAGVCARTGRRARIDLFETDEELGAPVLRRLLKRSDQSGKWAMPNAFVASELSGRLALREETVRCRVCGRTLIQAEAFTSPRSGLAACPGHFATCEKSGARLLQDELARCEVTGRLVDGSFLRTCPETRKRAVEDAFATCGASGERILPEGLEKSSVSGTFVRRSLLVECSVSGRRALKSELVRCAASGVLVHPDLTIRCPETGRVVLRSEGRPCAETGDLVSQEGLGVCSETGLEVRRSLLSRDELTGKAVLRRLLGTCTVSGSRTLIGNLVRSAVTAQAIRRDLAAQCQRSGRWALPEELGRCARTGNAVLPEFLERCGVSGLLVLQELLGTCAATATRALPDYLQIDPRSGRTVLSSHLKVSELSARVGLRGDLRCCAFSGRYGFPEELGRSQFSNREVALDRLRHCEHCGRSVDVSELARCPLCERLHCADDGGEAHCNVCSHLDSKGPAASVSATDLKVITARHPWVSAGRLFLTPKLAYIDARSGALSLKKRRSLLLFVRAETSAAGTLLGRFIAEKSLAS